MKKTRHSVASLFFARFLPSVRRGLGDVVQHQLVVLRQIFKRQSNEVAITSGGFIVVANLSLQQKLARGAFKVYGDAGAERLANGRKA